MFLGESYLGTSGILRIWTSIPCIVIDTTAQKTVDKETKGLSLHPKQRKEILGISESLFAPELKKMMN